MFEIIPVILGLYLFYRLLNFIGSIGSKFIDHNRSDLIEENLKLNNMLEIEKSLDELLEVEKSLGSTISELRELFVFWSLTFLNENENYMKIVEGIFINYTVHENHKIPHKLEHQFQCSEVHEKLLDDFKLFIKVTNTSALAHYDISDNKEKDISDPYKELSEASKNELFVMFNNIVDDFFISMIEVSEEYGCDDCLDGYTQLFGKI